MQYMDMFNNTIMSKSIAKGVNEWWCDDQHHQHYHNHRQHYHNYRQHYQSSSPSYIRWDPLNTSSARLFQVRLVFPLRFLVSETSHTSVYLLRVSCMPHSSFRAWIDPTSKKEGHCDITARTVLLYVLFCLIYMYCTLYVLYILHTVHTVHVPCFPVSDVEVSSSTSVHTLVHT